MVWGVAQHPIVQQRVSGKRINMPNACSGMPPHLDVHRFGATCWNHRSVTTPDIRDVRSLINRPNIG